MARLYTAVRHISGARLYFDDSTGLVLRDLEARATLADLAESGSIDDRNRGMRRQDLEAEGESTGIVRRRRYTRTGWDHCVPLVPLWSEYVLPRVEGLTRYVHYNLYDYDEEKMGGRAALGCPPSGHLLRRYRPVVAFQA